MSDTAAITIQHERGLVFLALYEGETTSRITLLLDGENIILIQQSLILDAGEAAR